MTTAGESAYIRRLKERIRKDPGSKLFLSFAEELKKRGRLEDAVSVLADGLKKNPGFIGAQLTLGRWYFSMDMFVEAKREFSEVLGKAPDNPFARKWLVEAKRNLGESIVEEPGPEPRESETAEAESQLPEITDTAGLDESALLPQPDVETSVPDESQVAGLLSEAEACIASGKYAKALRIYNDILESSRNNARVQQKKEELTLLIKLAGRDKGSAIERLNRLSSLISDRFAAKRTLQKEIAVDRLNRLSDAIKSRYA